MEFHDPFRYSPWWLLTTTKGNPTGIGVTVQRGGTRRRSWMLKTPFEPGNAPYRSQEVCFTAYASCSQGPILWKAKTPDKRRKARYAELRQVSDLSSTDQGMWELREGGCREPPGMGRSKGTLKGQGSCYTPSPKEASTANHDFSVAPVELFSSPALPPQAPSQGHWTGCFCAGQTSSPSSLYSPTQTCFQGQPIHHAQKAWKLKSITPS